MKLTGKEVYAAYVSVWPAEDQRKFTPFDELYEGTQQVYEGIARRINEAHIAPLQGLLWEWQRWANENKKEKGKNEQDFADKEKGKNEQDFADMDAIELDVRTRRLIGRKHQHYLMRQYQFPNAALTIRDGENMGWVVNVLHMNALYGVVRYSPHGDDVAWIENKNHFGTDKARAQAWVREQLEELKKEQPS